MGQTVYQRVREIHFVNTYKLDEHVLERLIAHIERGDSALCKVTFLYYDYMETNADGQPVDFKIFKDPDTLDAGLVARLRRTGWNLRHGVKGKSGYKIAIYCV